MSSKSYKKTKVHQDKITKRNQTCEKRGKRKPNFSLGMALDNKDILRNKPISAKCDIKAPGFISSP